MRRGACRMRRDACRMCRDALQCVCTDGLLNNKWKINIKINIEFRQRDCNRGIMRQAPPILLRYAHKIEFIILGKS